MNPYEEAPETNLPLAVHFGREICGDLAAAEQREWLVTNGLGGFASGTVAGLLTRRYHGLLIAALRPPLGRTLLVAKLDEVANYAGVSFSLHTNRWAGGIIDPHGYRHVERFRLDGTTPVWTFACSDALVEKRIWMQQDANTTFVQYTLIRGQEPLQLELRALVNYRPFHSTTHPGDWQMAIKEISYGLRITAREGALPFDLLSAQAHAEPAHEWHRNFDLAGDRSQGMSDREDHFHAGTFRATLRPGERATIIFSAEPDTRLDGAYESHQASEEALLQRWVEAQPAAARLGAPSWVQQLILAANQFLVRRPLPGQAAVRSIIAGYPWFAEWGRDTMIALPGLALATGRPDMARTILRSFVRFVDQGMLPNNFSETGDAPGYNNVDAALWYFEAVRQYYLATRDRSLLAELFPVLLEIIDWHVRGTRYKIHLDTADGLLYAGEPGVQLTWMDAKVLDWVVTPRIGKPVEINALWLNALATLARVARILQRQATDAEFMANRARAGYRRFWNESAGYCFDVMDGPEGDDPSLRPNQIFAVTLPVSGLTIEQQRAVVDVCARNLLTSYGLRSLAPREPGYRGKYGGGLRERDAAYHQGTAWGWLLGPFVIAHLRVYNDPHQAASFLEPVADHLQTHGLGSASEIFDGDAPFTPRGCIAQAWTVGELLRAWTEVKAAEAEKQAKELLKIEEPAPAKRRVRPPKDAA